MAKLCNLWMPDAGCQLCENSHDHKLHSHYYYSSSRLSIFLTRIHSIEFFSRNSALENRTAFALNVLWLKRCNGAELHIRNIASSHWSRFVPKTNDGSNLFKNILSYYAVARMECVTFQRSVVWVVVDRELCRNWNVVDDFSYGPMNAGFVRNNCDGIMLVSKMLQNNGIIRESHEWLQRVKYFTEFQDFEDSIFAWNSDFSAPWTLCPDALLIENTIRLVKKFRRHPVKIQNHTKFNFTFISRATWNFHRKMYSNQCISVTAATKTKCTRSE